MIYDINLIFLTTSAFLMQIFSQHAKINKQTRKLFEFHPAFYIL